MPHAPGSVDNMGPDDQKKPETWTSPRHQQADHEGCLYSRCSNRNHRSAHPLLLVLVDEGATDSIKIYRNTKVGVELNPQGLGCWSEHAFVRDFTDTCEEVLVLLRRRRRALGGGGSVYEFLPSHTPFLETSTSWGSGRTISRNNRDIAEKLVECRRVCDEESTSY